MQSTNSLNTTRINRKSMQIDKNHCESMNSMEINEEASEISKLPAARTGGISAKVVKIAF